jgi:hypothetical protein
MPMRLKRPLASAVIVGLALSWLVACGDQTSRWPSTKFDSGKWIQAKESERYIFARDLLDRKLLLGLTKTEVVALLGAPSSEPQGASYFTYVIKADTGAVHILDVRLSETEPRIVKEVFVRSD